MDVTLLRVRALFLGFGTGAELLLGIFSVRNSLGTVPALLHFDLWQYVVEFADIYIYILVCWQYLSVYPRKSGI